MSSRLDTIAAIATAPGSGGVAIIRVSGNDALTIVGSVFRRKHGRGIPEARRIYVGRLLDVLDGGVIDEVLVFAMKGPRSYTGEDVVEVQCHGGSIISQRVLESICAAGARIAQPGEFTKRAFLNGRMDLAQAEAVSDLIMARSEAGRRMAWSQLEGTLSARVGALRDTVVRARALCEVALDFPEDEVPELAGTELVVQLATVQRELEVLTQSFKRGYLRYQGARVALIGRPNVGKSSLLNAMVGRERALVTPIAGTTRDVVEGCVAIGGTPVVLMDTAGIRETGDSVEALGVALSRSAAEEAACVIAVFDRSTPTTGEDRLVAELARRRPVVAVFNKADLPAEMLVEEMQTLCEAKVIVEVSAVTGAGISDLASAIVRVLFESGDSVEDDEVIMFRVRHRDAAQRAIEDLSRAQAALAVGAPLELVATDLMSASAALASITGEVTSEDVLDRVFADFCLGK